MIRFYLHFKSDNFGKIEISEPVGFASADFQLKQEDKRYARDISFSGGESEFSFYDRTHEEALNQLLYYNQKFGFESLVSLIIKFDDVTENIIGDLHFQTAETDGLTYFKCKVVQDSNQAKLKRRSDIKVNLISDKDLDGNDIAPLVAENILLKAKPIKQDSRWEQLNTYSKNHDSLRDTTTTLYTFNPAMQLKEYGIEDSFSFFESTVASIVMGDPESDYRNQIQNEFKVITAKQNLSNIKITTSDFNFNVETDVDNGGNGYVDGGLYIRYGETISNSQIVPLFDYSLSENQNYSTGGVLSFTIPFIKRGDTVWFFFYQKVRQSADNIGSVPRFEAFTTVTDFNFDITATSVAYNTVVPSFRLYDIMQQTVKSIAGLEIEAPKFQPSAEYYDQRIFNGNCLRGLTDKPFYVTLEQLGDCLQEFNADYEIKPTNDVFFGLYPDFYTSTEVGFMDAVQFDSMKKTYNKRYCLNQFSYKFNSYQSQKENTAKNTYDVVHGESQWILPNLLVENKKEVEVKWIRDAFDIEFNRRRSFEEQKTTATQDDDKLYAIDTIAITEESERYFTETAVLLHSYSSGINKLTNDGSFNWLLFGLRIGEQFEILSSKNAGVFEITEIANNFIALERIGGGVSDLQGEFKTTFKYYVSSLTANYTVWTNQGFTLINNLNNPDNYANLRFTNKQDILNFWQQYLATANLYKKDKTINNTFYKNNPDCATTYEGNYVVEGGSFIPLNPILTPVLYENVTFICSFKEFKEFENKIRTDRGYFRFIDNDNFVIKGYPTNLKFSDYKQELVCDLEEKYEPSIMSITTPISGLIVINEETRVNELIFEFDSNKLFIFDTNRQPLYNGVFWQNVTINGAFASSLNELNQWLQLL